MTWRALPAWPSSRGPGPGGAEMGQHLAAFFNFDTMAGEYGLQAKLTYDSAFVLAEIKANIAHSGECDDSPQVVTGRFVWTTPSSSEAVALLRGEQRCVVDDDETDPVMVISGAMREFVYTPVPGVQLVIQNMRVDMFGYVDAGLGITANASTANDTDRTAWSFADLAFRLEMSGTINLFGTDGVPDLGGMALEMDVFASLAFEWTATSSELRPVEVVAHVAFTQGDEDAPTMRVAGDAAFTWPCVPGAAIAFPGTVDLRMGVFIVEAAAGNASLACGTKVGRCRLQVDSIKPRVESGAWCL